MTGDVRFPAPEPPPERVFLASTLYLDPFSLWREMAAADERTYTQIPLPVGWNPGVPARDLFAQEYPASFPMFAAEMNQTPPPQPSRRTVPMPDLLDHELLALIDEHEFAVEPDEADALAGWIDRLARGRPLSPKQRRWAEDILVRLDGGT